MANHAQRFMQMVQSLDAILNLYDDYERPAKSNERLPPRPFGSVMPLLKWVLLCWVGVHIAHGQIVLSDTGLECVYMRNPNPGDGRRQLPASIRNVLKLAQEDKEEDILVTWRSGK